jgi:ribosomal protein S18 acetylase RimI-like enzyme
MELAIEQSIEPSVLEYFLEVLQSYSPDEREVEENRVVLQQEFRELGENRVVYIAWEGTSPIAVTQLLLKRADNDPQLADGTTVAHVHHLRVAQHRQRQGVGRMLMRHVENEARALGCQRVTLGVDSWNPGALAFYRRIGYAVFREEIGPFPDTTLYYMGRDLTEEPETSSATGCMTPDTPTS